ncbi:hypothetical protein AMS68_006160 [Peltaster fructicola]|uniref:Uncharacterized protein n=1 Tax=Peltaster fructicola TaxID=286661 RepID=A0A6H0Y0V6_9PEZI|nr:hypothetical protein AMS68_006160 [Peltaster fructicola]
MVRIQILPEIAGVADQITVFQRTPNYIIPRLDAPVGVLERAIYKYLRPVLWRRRALMMDFRESFYPAVTDKNSPAAKEIRQQCLDQMHAALPNQEELWKLLTPKYEPGAKRVIISDDYYPALARPNVHLETRSIHAISRHSVSVKDQDGQIKDAAPKYDLLVCATGFKTVDFLHPIKIVGRNGRALGDVWKDGAQALYGVTSEDMPNFAMLYGPNTNLGHNSIILMIEAQSRYINALIAPVLQARQKGTALAIRPSPERVSEYNDGIQKVLQASSFNDPNCTSWYRNAAGRITNNWSGTVVEYQKLLSKVDFTDYYTEGDVDTVQSNSQVYLGRVVEETQVSNTTLGLGLLSAAAIGAGWLLRRSYGMTGLLTSS